MFYNADDVMLGADWAEAAGAISTAAGGAVSSIFGFKAQQATAKSQENIARMQADAAALAAQKKSGFALSTPMLIAAGVAALLLVGAVAWRR